MLLLHIGTPKTGTTSLQNFLARNSGELFECGVRYIEAGRDVAHHELPRSLQSQGERPAWNRVREEIADSESRINILSSEGFWNCDPAAIKEELRNVEEIKIILYLRRQDKYLQSMYKQYIVAGGKSDFSSWQRGIYLRAHYLSVVEKWASQFGQEAILIRPYEYPEGAVDVIEDFCRIVGVEPHRLSGGQGERHGISPRRELIYFIRAMNHLELNSGRYKFLISIVEKQAKYARSADLFTHEECVSLLESYSQENQILAEKYYKNGDSTLFPPIIPGDPAIVWGLDDKEFFELTMDVLDTAIRLAGAGKLSSKVHSAAKAKRKSRRN